MSPRRHRIPADLLALLAEGGGGPAAVGRLAAIDLSRRMLLVSGVVAVSRQSGRATNDLASQSYELLAAVQQEAPRAVDAVLRHPAVGAWAWRTVLAASSGRPSPLADPAGLALVAGAAAIRARYSCDLPVPVTDGAVMFPSLGQALVPPQSDDQLPRLCSRPDGAVVLAGGARLPIPANAHRDAAGWRGLRAISATADGAVIRLVIDDLDPHRMPLPTLRGRLGADEVGAWQAGLAGAWRLLVRHHAYVAAEISATIRVLTPLSPPAAGAQVSATSRETFGCVGVSTAADPLELAATLAHEVQHAKLYQIVAAEQLTLPDPGRYYAPWRDDPRPLTGLLQGVYAYLGVAGFWRTQRRVETGENELRAHAEFARWRAAIAMATRTLLGSRRLTPAGQAFVSRMAQVADAWCAEPVPAAAEARARDEAAGHARRWHAD
jgi:HEXXH motif-containing protein